MFMLGLADIGSSALAAGVRYPIQATDYAQRDSPAKLKTTVKSPSSAPAPPPGSRAAQGQGGTTPPTERDIIRQKRLQQFTSDTSDKSDSNPTQSVGIERTASYPLLSPAAAITSSTADIPTLDSSPSGLRFEVGDMIQVDRPDSASWYGVIRWIGILSGSSSPSAGIDMVYYILLKEFHYSPKYEIFVKWRLSYICLP